MRMMICSYPGMVATIGMIVPDLFGRFGGDLSPLHGLASWIEGTNTVRVSALLRKFSDIPCTIEADRFLCAWTGCFAVACLLNAEASRIYFEV